MSDIAASAIPTELVKSEMSLIEKVKLMSDLANACQNEEVVSKIKNLPNGERIYSIFIEAVDRELQVIMNGKKEDVPKELVNAINMTRQLQGTLTNFQNLISGFMGTPLVQVLNMMNQNLGGKAFQAPTQQPVMQPQYNPQPQPQYETVAMDESRSRRSGVVGLGSV